MNIDLERNVPVCRLRSVSDAAKTLDCATTTVYRRIADGSLNPVIVGNRWFLDAEEINKLAASRATDNKPVRTLADLNKRNRDKYKRRSHV